MWKSSKYISILLWVLVLVSVLLCGYAFVGCGRLYKGQIEELMAVINPMLIWAYILVGVAAALAVFMPVPQVARNPKSALGIAAGFLGFVVVVGLAYLFAAGDPLPFTPGHEPVTEGTIKFADVNIIAVYIMLFSTILVTLGASVWNMFKLR